jgi:hypothetical protein
MPIKGVSEVVRLPRLGKIKLGVKKENEGISFPSPTDYFVCPDEVRKVFGDKPKELRVMFPTEEQTQWASQYLRCYSASRGLICRGDGETAVARVDIRTGEIATHEAAETELRDITCNPTKCAYHESDRCRRVMNLQFLLPDCPGFGVYQLNTTSFYSIVNVNSSLELIRGTCGRLAMIPLLLKLVEQEVQLDANRKKIVRVLSLTAPYSLTEIQKYARIPPGQVLLLPAPDSEVPDDLFPDEVLEGNHESKKKVSSRELLNLWERVKSKVWRFDVRDAQIADFFRRNHKIDVRLSDFDLLEPPSQITAEALEHFLKTLERLADQT